MSHVPKNRAGGRESILLVALALTGCGGSSTAGSETNYPLVVPTPPPRQAPMTTPSGAVVTLPALPTVYDAAPSPSCERTLATFHDGSRPARRPLVIPPRPGLRAVAVTERTTRVEWSFSGLPDDCRPVEVAVSVRNGTHVGATPTTQQVRVRGAAGSVEIRYPEFLPAPNVALASAYSREGRRSRTVSVLIKRAPDLPADPAEPSPPVTAAAGRPIVCTGRTTVATDPIGDVLTYQPGSPPAPVARRTPALSGIDITRAAVQIQGRTICGTFALARPPGALDFKLTLSVRDASNSACCASLRFRTTNGRLELGSETYDPNGLLKVTPVEGAGAELRGTTLVITGTLPPPHTWPHASGRMPAAADLGWSLTTGYFPEKYGPYFGDWVPAHEAVSQPLVRHRDGAVVRPTR